MAEPYKVYEGEIVQPDAFDRLYDYINLQARNGKLTKAQVREVVDRQSPEFEPDAARALLAGFGGMLGSLYKAPGAAVGAGLASLLYDLTKSYIESQRQYKPSKRYLLRDRND